MIDYLPALPHNRTLARLAATSWIVRTRPGTPVPLAWDGGDLVTVHDLLGRERGRFPAPEPTGPHTGPDVHETLTVMDDWLADFAWAAAQRDTGLVTA